MRQEGDVKDLNEKLHDGSFRRSMMKRYLDAGTSVEEEKALAAYFLFNAPDEDEREFALLLRISVSGNLLSEKAVEEFDRLVRRPSGRLDGKRRRTAGIWMAAGFACAAALALFFILRTPAAVSTAIDGNGFAHAFSVAEMTDCIERITAVCGDRITSVSVNPVGNAALLTVNLKDNSSIKYIMTHNGDEGSTSVIALNDF